MEQARKAERQAQVRADRAKASERKRFEKEAKAAHIEAMEAQAAEMNAQLTELYDGLDNLLAATLEVDDFVDLESLKRRAEHPPLDLGDLGASLPPMPAYQPPPRTKGLFGRKRRQAEAVASANEAHKQEIIRWRHQIAVRLGNTDAIPLDAEDAERMRLQEVDAAQLAYQRECAQRDAETCAHNAAIDKLSADLGYGVREAVDEYIGIVLGNSVYPDSFEVTYEFSYLPEAAELQLSAIVPAPAAMPSIKEYKYRKSSDEITSSQQTRKACQDRYASAVFQVALRTLHEVFEADRRGLIRSISLEVATRAIDPATGNPVTCPFVAAAAQRDQFLTFNLEAVVPDATLTHLGATISKNPYGLVAIDSSGIRRS